MMTTPREALAAMGDGNIVRVKTSSGIEYDVERDVVEVAVNESDPGFGYVYGYRVKAGGSARHHVPAGAVEWFDLKNVTVEGE